MHQRQVLKLFASNLMCKATKNRKWVLALGIAFVIIAGFGTKHIKVDNDALNLLPKDHFAHTQNTYIEEQLGPYVPIDFFIDFEKGWQQAQTIKQLRNFQNDLAQLPQIGNSFSIANIFDEVSDTDNLSAIQIAMIRSKIRNENFYSEWVSKDEKSLRLTVFTKSLSAKRYTQLAESIDRIFYLQIEGAALAPTGYLPLYSAIVSRLVNDFAKSFAIAFGFILILLLLFLRNLKLTLIAIPANILPVLMMLGCMGYLGIDLDLATITVLATVVGIVVDDSIHLLYRYKQLKHNNNRIEITAQSTGNAIITTSIILCLGYLILGLSNIPLIANSGILIIITIVSALFGDLVILPALFNKSTNR